VSAATRSARKALIWLGVILGLLYGLLGIGVATGNATWFPSLALDLAGGRQIILQAVTSDGSEITQSDLDQAVQIIRKRVDASGVAEAEITTAGTSNIIVSLPGNPDESTLDLVRRSAQLQFRPVLYIGDPAASVTATASPTPTPSATASAEATPSSNPTASPEVSISPVETAAPSPSPSPSATAAPDDTPASTPADPSDPAWLSDELLLAFAQLDCFDPENRAGADAGDPTKAHIACSQDGSAKYALGPVELAGTDIASATSGPELAQGTGSMTGRYEIRLQLTDAGGAKFADTTARLAELEQPRNQFAILLDGVVISDPAVSSRIPGGTASITGSFTQEGAEQLANQLKFGALPLTLEVQSEQQIAATKGAQELQMGLIAGLIGLLLVVVYSLFQYRALGMVTVGSLVIAGALTLVTFSLLSWGMGLRLSLAGIAGMIVAIGITADSFIVYFERIKDEIRDGRSLVSAVDHGWTRARRTILVSDAVSFLAAVVLYVLAVGGVRGFAFTLGLTTLVDLLVVLLFTHPIMVLLARTQFFGRGHKMSGLDPRSLGRDSLYKGAGKVRETVPVGAASSAEGASAASELTLAERKAKARAASTAEDGE
jgi:preprotein translocase subunit SecD